MKTFPINVKLAGMPVLVIGGGSFAAEKLERLIPHQPRLTILCPMLGPAVDALVRAHGLHHVQAPYDPMHLKGQRLIYAADDDQALNRRVYSDTRALPVLVNAVDMPDCCDFIMPAVVAGEHFSLAISSGGTAAGYARQWREQLEAAVTQEDGIMDVLEKIRAVLKRKVATFDARRERLWAILKELEAIEKTGGDGA
ncbi:MAG: bifunctional precorrin-2 dehydrogenase/sirohydrochlorin ferrochelatase [Verrucomicrobia bacterium]|nr:bifunctional precorrin-2 dehydrogenase/sirohydrochlorin ferrochelatase [Verrucomicrobiota bacterium]